jgi:hypothetical protein
MSLHREGPKWAVRWQEDGHHKTLSFDKKKDALAFEHALQDTQTQARQARRVREALERARQS